LDEIGPLAQLALGRPVSAEQRHAAGRLVEDRIEVLGRQLTVLRKLRDSVRRPDFTGPAQQIVGWQDQPKAPTPPGAAS
jgi:hypothetical protein